MRSQIFNVALALACLLHQASAAPVPAIAKRQGAGVGAGCDSIFSDSDTTVGDLTESEGQNIANKLHGGARLMRRQGAGVGAGCDSVFSDTDTTVGDLTQSEGQNIANELKGTGQNGGQTGGNQPAPAPAPGPKGPKAKRQANGIGYGIADVMNAAGAGAASQEFGSTVNTIDGETTDGSAALGQSIGEGELSVGQALETATGAADSYSQGGAHTTARERRQANGIGYGIEDVMNAAGAGQAGAEEGSAVNTIDGDTTDGSAQTGASVGAFEEAMGQSVETMTGAQDSYSHGGAHPSKE